MFSGLYFLQFLLLNSNLQLDKLILIKRWVNYKFFLIIPFILISWMINTYRSGDWQNLTYLYFNILFIYYILLARLPKLKFFSIAVSDLLLIAHCILIFLEGSTGRAAGLLGVNGAFVFLVFSLSHQNHRGRLFFLLFMSLFIAYFTGSRSTLVLTSAIFIYLTLKIDLSGKFRVLIKLVFLLMSVSIVYISIEYVLDNMLRGITLELVLTIADLNYSEIVDKFSDSPLISDLDRLASINVFLQNFDLSCTFGCYWDHERPLHNTLLELIYYTGILGMVTVCVFLVQLFKLTISSVPSGILMACASIALITGPIQFYPIYYYSLKMLMNNLRAGKELV
jgi:hypothetical protein